jgi:hypothetical protein
MAMMTAIRPAILMRHKDVRDPTLRDALNIVGYFDASPW